MNNRLAVVGVAVVGLVGVATFGVAQSPTGGAPAGGVRPRLTSSADSPGLDSSRAPLRGSPLEGDLSPGSSRGSATLIRIDHALVTSLDPIKLPARDAGAIKSITVKKGNEVKENDVVGQLDDKDSQTKKKIAELERDAAKLQADSDAQIKAAKDGSKVTEENYRANEKLRNERPGSLSEFDFRRSWFEWQRAQAQIAVAEVEKAVAYATQLAKEGQIEGAENEIERRKIVAPIDGIVTEIYKHKGEWCQPGDPVMEIVRMDRVEVEGFVYAADASPAKVLGKPVDVMIQLAGGETYKATGTITFASPVLEGSGRIRQFRVSTEVDNKKEGTYWVIQPGTEAEMVINLSPPAPKPAVAPKTGSPAGLKPSLPRAPVESYKPPVPDANAKTKTGTKSDATTKPAETKPAVDKAAPAKTGDVKPAADGSTETKLSEKSDKPVEKSEQESGKPSKVKL